MLPLFSLKKLEFQTFLETILCCLFVDGQIETGDFIFFLCLFGSRAD